jgi:hypothetical protein
MNDVDSVVLSVRAEARQLVAITTRRSTRSLPKLELRSEPADLADPLAELLIFGLLAEPASTAVVRNGAVLAACASPKDRPELPFWPMLFANVTIRLLGSDNFPAEAKDAAARDLTEAAARSALTRTGCGFIRGSLRSVGHVPGLSTSHWPLAFVIRSWVRYNHCLSRRIRLRWWILATIVVRIFRNDRTFRNLSRLDASRCAQAPQALPRAA